MHTAQTN